MPTSARKKGLNMSNPLKPSVSLLAGLASVIVHADEAMSEGGLPIDRAEFHKLLEDQDIVEWLQSMRIKGLVPIKRIQRR